jgi:hypothetical protein
MMLDAARTYRNCLRDLVVEAMRGEAYFYESRLLGVPVVIRLERHGSASGWKVEGLYGRGTDEPVNPSDAIMAWMEARGIATNQACAKSWLALERLWCE